MVCFFVPRALESSPRKVWKMMMNTTYILRWWLGCLRPSKGTPMVNKPWIRPFFLGGYVRGPPSPIYPWMPPWVKPSVCKNSKVTQVVSCGPVGNASVPHHTVERWTGWRSGWLWRDGILPRGFYLDLPKQCKKWFRFTGVKQTIPSG